MVFWGGVTFILVILSFWTIFCFWGNRLLQAMYDGTSLSFFNLSKEYRAFWSVRDLMVMARKIGLIFVGLIALSAMVVFQKGRLIRVLLHLFRVENVDELKPKLFSLGFWLGCSWVCFYALYSFSYQGEWYRIDKIMTFTEGPPYQHRILFVWVARGIQAIFPGLSDLGCYFLSQTIPILLSFHFIKQWGALFIAGKLAFLAQILLVILLIPTFKYYTFYDMGIVLFYTLALLFLFRRQFALYLLVLLVGTLNHEITLFLIFLFALLFYKDDLKRAHYWGLIFVQLSVYGMIRFLLFYWLPTSEAWGSGRVWFNIDFIVHPDRRLLFVILNLVFWYCLASLGLKQAPKTLKQSALLLPLLLATTFLVGQLNEIRHFDPFIPVVIGLILSFIASGLAPKKEGKVDGLS